MAQNIINTDETKDKSDKCFHSLAESLWLEFLILKKLYPGKKSPRIKVASKNVKPIIGAMKVKFDF